jgi:hypothetical protein
MTELTENCSSGEVYTLIEKLRGLLANADALAIRSKRPISAEQTTRFFICMVASANVESLRPYSAGLAPPMDR